MARVLIFLHVTIMHQDIAIKLHAIMKPMYTETSFIFLIHYNTSHEKENKKCKHLNLQIKYNIKFYTFL